MVIFAIRYLVANPHWGFDFSPYAGFRACFIFQAR